MPETHFHFKGGRDIAGGMNWTDVLSFQRLALEKDDALGGLSPLLEKRSKRWQDPWSQNPQDPVNQIET